MGSDNIQESLDNVTEIAESVIQSDDKSADITVKIRNNKCSLAIDGNQEGVIYALGELIGKTSEELAISSETIAATGLIIANIIKQARDSRKEDRP